MKYDTVSSNVVYFSCTGYMVNFTVPSYVTSMDVDIAGAAGGAGSGASKSISGYGARVIQTGGMVTPGAILYIFVGGRGVDSGSAQQTSGSVQNGGFNGGKNILVTLVYSY